MQAQISEQRLSVRKAEVISKWLKENYSLRVSASDCRSKTPAEIAVSIYGYNSKEARDLTREIERRLEEISG